MKLRQIIVLSYGVAAVSIVACSSGTGSPISFGSPYDQGPGDFNRPTEDNQDPSPASAGGNTGASRPTGGGSSSGSSSTTPSNPPSGSSGNPSSSGSSGTNVTPPSGP